MFFLEVLSSADHQVTSGGEYASEDEVIAAAHRVIDEFMRSQYAPGMSAAMLFLRYQTQGWVPFIFRDHGSTAKVRRFSHINVAKRRAAELCSGSTMKPGA